MLHLPTGSKVENRVEQFVFAAGNRFEYLNTRTVKIEECVFNTLIVINCNLLLSMIEPNVSN